MSKGYLGLPVIKQDDFNAISKKYFGADAVCWVKDTENPGVVDPNEVAVCEGSGAKLDTFVIGGKFTTTFDGRYQSILQKKREEFVAQEMAKVRIVHLTSDLAKFGLKAKEIQMSRHILKAGELIQDAFQMQLGSAQYREPVMTSGTQTDRDFFTTFQKPWCASTKDPLCSALATFVPEVSPMYPEGMQVTDLKGALETPFTVVKKDDKGEYVAVPYAKSFLGPKMAEAAKELRAAAKLADEVGETYLAKYMRATADAFGSDKLYPYGESDKAWVEMQGKSRYYLRIGPDEVAWHPWNKKAGFSMAFGIIDPAASKAVEVYGSKRQAMEDHFAAAIGAPYKARQVNILLPDFISVIMEKGDARGGIKGTPVGQTLPNWCGDDGAAECTNRTMIYTNKQANSYSKEVLEKFALLLAPESLQYLDPASSAQNTMDHEFAHNLGPQMGMEVDGKSLKEHLGDYVLWLEELKAQTGSLFLKPWLVEQKVLPPEALNKAYTSAIMWNFSHLKRAIGYYEQGKLHEFSSPYTQLAAVQIGYLTEKGVISFDEKTQKFSIDYKKMPAAMDSLLKEVGQLYMGHDKEKAVAFFQKYTKGEGLKMLHMEAIKAAIGDLPSTLYEYEVKGI